MTLVHVLLQQKDNGNQSDAGWKTQVWQAVADALKAEGPSKGPAKTSKKCTDHWTNLKKNFLEVSAICNTLGFGWDEDTNLYTASNDVWNKYIAAHLGAECWRSTPFPLYNDIYILINGIVVTRDSAFLPRRSLSSTITTASIEAESSETGELLVTSINLSSFSIYCDTLTNDVINTSNSGELKPKTPCKRTRAESHSPEHKKRYGKRQKTQADSLFTGMMGALLKLSKSMNSGSGIPTSQHCEKAIDCLFEDQAFSPDEAGELLELFAENMAYADTYSATKNKDAHILFGCKLITRKQKEAEELA